METVIDRILRTHAGRSMDEPRPPRNACLTSRETIEIANEIADLRARVEVLEAGLREIEEWAPNWAQGVDENVDAIRDFARALLEQRP